jgi:nitrogen fixation protein FixH
MSMQMTGRQLTGRHVAYMLGAFFGVMFAVNGAFVYFALGSFSGLSETDAYKRGLAYNQELDHRERQLARHWQPSLEFIQKEGDNGSLVLEMMDSQGNRLTALTVSATLRRPVIDGSDRSIDFLYDGGRYVADLAFAGPGQWDVSILANGGGFEEPYRLDKRIWVK